MHHEDELLKRYKNFTILHPSLSSLLVSAQADQLSSLSTLPTHDLANPDNGLHSIYHPYAAIESLLKMLASDYPSFAQLEEIGRSAWGRSIYSLKISDYRKNQSETRTWRQSSRNSAGKAPSPKDRLKQKLGFAIIGGQHAREWVSPASMLYVAHSLLASVSTLHDEASDSVLIALGDYEFHFIPVLNPDGYVHSWTSDRLWQKNRQQTQSEKPECCGIDLNRNWEYKHEKAQRPNPCSDLYPGEIPFEAVELQAISGYLKRIKEESRLDIFLDIHSFGQMRGFHV